MTSVIIGKSTLEKCLVSPKNVENLLAEVQPHLSSAFPLKKGLINAANMGNCLTETSASCNAREFTVMRGHRNVVSMGTPSSITRGA